MLQMMGAFAQFEREIILERQKEGIKLASAQGKYKGRVHKLKPDQAGSFTTSMEGGEVSIENGIRESFWD